MQLSMQSRVRLKCSVMSAKPDANGSFNKWQSLLWLSKWFTLLCNRGVESFPHIMGSKLGKPRINVDELGYRGSGRIQIRIFLHLTLSLKTCHLRSKGNSFFFKVHAIFTLRRFPVEWSFFRLGPQGCVSLTRGSTTMNQKTYCACKALYLMINVP